MQQMTDDLARSTVDQVHVNGCSTVSSIHPECEVLMSVTPEVPKALVHTFQHEGGVLGNDNSQGTGPTHNGLMPSCLTMEASTSDTHHPSTPEQHQVSSTRNVMDSKCSLLSNGVSQIESELPPYANPDGMVASHLLAPLLKRHNGLQICDDLSVCTQTHAKSTVKSKPGEGHPAPHWS